MSDTATADTRDRRSGQFGSDVSDTGVGGGGARCVIVGGVYERGTGDGFIRCSDGHVRWGIYGAAGVLFVVLDGSTPLVMLQKRSAMAHEGGTWSCAGGALHQAEMPLDGALREAAEEVGEIPEPYAVLGEHVFRPALDWAYTTLVVEVRERFGRSMNFETEAVAWFTPPEIDRLPLHAGFAAAWPHLRAIIPAGPPDPDPLTP